MIFIVGADPRIRPSFYVLDKMSLSKGQTRGFAPTGGTGDCENVNLFAMTEK